MLPTTRKEAIRLGASHYQTGKPCKHGHVDKRNTKSRSCQACVRMHRANQYARDADTINEQRRKARLENLEEARRKDREYYSANIDRKRATKRARDKKNPEKIRALSARRYAEKKQRTPKWANRKKMREFYTTAKIMTQQTGVQYTVDHIIPLRGDLVSGLHVENNLQVLTLEDNMKKGTQ